MRRESLMTGTAAASFRAATVPLLLAAGVVACDASSHRTTGGEDGEQEVEVVQSAVAFAPSCYGEMTRTSPSEYLQPIGRALTVRLNRVCEPGATPVARKLRIYIEGATGGKHLLMDWTDWARGSTTFKVPWSAASLLAGGALAPGRYRIFAYTLNADLYDAWLAEDPFARGMSKRSGNTWLELAHPGTWNDTVGACSATCGGGTQTRSSTCQDGNGNALSPYMCLTAQPAASQACNEQPCAAGLLYAVTGDRGTSPHTLFTLDPVTLAETQVAALGSCCGEAIVGKGTDIYRITGSAFSRVDSATFGITNVPLSQGMDEVGAITADGDGFLVGSTHQRTAYRISGGTVSLAFSLGFLVRGLAFNTAHTVLYGVSKSDATIRTLNPATGALVSSVTATSTVSTINGFVGLATNPSTGVLYGLLKQGGGRRLATIDPVTGVTTDLGNTNLNGKWFASIAFR